MTGMADIEWTESVDEPGRLPSAYADYIDPANPDFIDITNTPDLRNRSGVFTTWDSRFIRCPVTDVVSLSDTPRAAISQGKRTLKIRFTVTNPKCCSNRGFYIFLIQKSFLSGETPRNTKAFRVLPL